MSATTQSVLAGALAPCLEFRARRVSHAMISTRLAALLRRQLDLPAYEFQDDTKAFEVPGWDSLRHVQIRTAIEDEYGIRLKGLEVMKLRNIGELQSLFDQKSTTR